MPTDTFSLRAIMSSCSRTTWGTEQGQEETTSDYGFRGLTDKWIKVLAALNCGAKAGLEHY